MPMREIGKIEHKSWVKEKGEWVKPCHDPDHTPPGHMVLRPGIIYEHECPTCGKKTTLVGQETFFMEA